jgi:helicase
VEDNTAMTPPPRTNLFPSQTALLDQGFLESDDNWLICAPTGAGKTRMAEWALERAVDAGYRGAYLAPLKAIVDERLEEWANKYPEWSLGLFTGESTRRTGQTAPKSETVLLFTPEKLAGYLQNWKKHLPWLAELDAVAIDEIHLLGDANRGAVLEALIGRLQRINPFARIIGLSGTLSNHEQIANWLRARPFLTEWRPIPVSHRIRRFKRPADKAEILLEEVRSTVADGGRALVFVNSRRRAETLAADLRSAGLNADCNHAGLSRDHRDRSQKAMRAGDLDVMVATSTLEMGVNFPARKVIVHDAYCFDGERFAPLSIGRYRQFAGRAGRAGYDDQGEAVLLLPVWHRDAENYLTGEPEPVRSALFSTQNLLREILTEVAGRLSISEEHLEINFADRTLWRAQDGRKSLSLYVQHLVQAGLVKEKEKDEHVYLSTTALGRIAAQMALSPHTVGLLADFYRTVSEPTEFDILLITCLCREVTPKLGFNFEEIDQMADILLQVPSVLLDTKADWFLTPGRGLKEKALLSAVKCATLLYQHTQGISVETLAQHYDAYAADIHLLKTHLGWVLDAAGRIFGVLSRPTKTEEQEEQEPPSPVPHQEFAGALKLMVEYGIPRDALGLTTLPGIGPKRAQALVAHGIRIPAQLAETDTEDLRKALRLSSVTVSRLLQHARSSDAQSEPKFESPQDGPVSRQAPRRNAGDWPPDIDPYRLRRALELEIDHASAELLRISGGAEPHRVTVTEDAFRNPTYACDCADFGKGTANCKHILRARLEHNDPALLDLLRRWQDLKPKELRYSLGELWIRSGRTFDAFHGRDVDYKGDQFLARSRKQRFAR